MSFKAFIDAAKTIITVGASANASARQEIRDVVGKLGDELDRALMLSRAIATRLTVFVSR